MGIIIISRGSYSHGVEFAEALGERLGYKCISREALIKASNEFNIPELKLKTAIDNAPSTIDHLTYKKDKYLAFIRTSILEHLVQDNCIYHGICGHAFVQGVGHELSIRIDANFDDRVQRVMERDKVSKEEAQHFIKKIDEERREWSLYVTGCDPQDSSLYDLIFNVSATSEDVIIDNIVEYIQKPFFQATPESQREIEDLLLAARVKSSLVHKYPQAQVTANNGIVYVKVKSTLPEVAQKELEDIKEIDKRVYGIKDININILPLLPEDLKARILKIYPAIEQYKVDLDVSFDYDKHTWVAILQKGENELSTYIDPVEAENCIHGRECFYLGLHVGEFIKNFQPEYEI